MKRIGPVLAALALALSAAAAYAQSNVRHYYVYYERVVGHGDPVGYSIYYCDDTVQQTGEITQYYDEWHYDC